LISPFLLSAIACLVGGVAILRHARKERDLVAARPTDEGSPREVPALWAYRIAGWIAIGFGILAFAAWLIGMVIWR